MKVSRLGDPKWWIVTIPISETETESVRIEGPGNHYVLTVSAEDQFQTTVFGGEREDLQHLAEELRAAAQNGSNCALVGLTIYFYKMRWFRLDPAIFLRRLDNLQKPVG
ncbi:MAG: hypothetical protein ABSA63_06580 [Thermoplasmata archaeon]|jgi:hypothetical protein